MKTEISKIAFKTSIVPFIKTVLKHRIFPGELVENGRPIKNEFKAPWINDKFWFKKNH
jgi:hypothetical protein